MSLLTMKIFINALDESDDVTDLTGRRIWPVAFPGTDEEFENLETPYIIVGYTGPNNPVESKDQRWVGDEDTEQIHVLMVATDVDQLADLEEKVRHAIVEYFDGLTENDENYGLLPDGGINPQGDTVEYDPWKPAYSHTLTYQAETNSTATV